MKPEKLTICYIAWLIFNENDDYDDLLRQIAERKFNCIRIEDGAGLLWDQQGNHRKDVQVSAPFGKYTQYTTWRPIVTSKKLDLLERLIRICRTAKKYQLQVILSTWFFLHTNWFYEETDKARYFEMSTPEKMHFFGQELGRILDVLRRENLIDVVAFAEIFNEFDGLPFAGEQRGMDPEAATELRLLHEKEIADLKQKHPDVLFAFDSCTAYVQEELIPRNIDVWDFHIYYLWPLYYVFEKNLVSRSLEEPEIPAETRYFLKDELVSVKSVAESMDCLRTGLAWPRRISLYLSIDPAKENELTELLDRSLEENIQEYRDRLYNSVEKLLETHQKIVPHSKIVVGEGCTYCGSPTLAFERDSVHFWEMVKEHMLLFREKDFWGTIVSTTHAPDRTAAWDACKERYIQMNELFLESNSQENN